MSIRKKVVLLGATGSIGTTAQRILRAHPDRLELVGIAADSNIDDLAAVAREFQVPHVAISNPEAANRANKEKLFSDDCEIYAGPEALNEISVLPEADIILVAVVGTAALLPTLNAINAGKDIALANKEILVLGGKHIIEAARAKGIRLLPTDSEHNAIYQCLDGQWERPFLRMILTASGGQFRDRPLDSLVTITPEEATRHPNWSMGPKITVDSATMANKGLELFEAYWLFRAKPESLQVVLHPQSIVHSMVEFQDGSILAQLSPPNMSFAIQHCLLYPECKNGVDTTVDFTQALQLDFKPPSLQRYPCLDLAYQALHSGHAAMAIFNAANEIAVEAFLKNKLSFLDIPRVIELTLERVGDPPTESLDSLLAIDSSARGSAIEAISKLI